MKDIKKIYIRTDMNNVIATGHMMRCMSLADAAKKLGIEAVFITADYNGGELINKRGYDYIVLNTVWNQMETELEDMSGLIESENIECLIVDSYQVTEKYLRTLSEKTKTVYIDDLNSFVYPVHAVICYANYYDKFSYDVAYKGNVYNTRFLLGTNYVPLRAEFMNLPKKVINDRVKEVLVLSGGADPYNSMGKILDSITDMGLEKIHAICGRYTPNIELLKTRFEGTEVKLYSSVDNLIDMIRQVDVAISAGGTTLYELCACGTPTITYSFADNQLDNVKQFKKDGLMEYAGDVRNDDISTNLIEEMKEYGSVSYREKLSLAMQKAVDGNGAKRVIQDLISIVNE